MYKTITFKKFSEFVSNRRALYKGRKLTLCSQIAAEEKELNISLSYRVYSTSLYRAFPWADLDARLYL